MLTYFLLWLIAMDVSLYLLEVETTSLQIKTNYTENLRKDRNSAERSMYYMSNVMPIRQNCSLTLQLSFDV